jgi:hypothetical protein
MGFLSPWYLLGAIAVGLPLWLHLLKHFRSTPHPFSSLMFFEKRVQSSVRHRRLRYLVLLALRIAMLVLLALAFANPFINRTSVVAAGRRMRVIAIDRSFSMRYGDHMEQAKERARHLLQSVPGAELMQVVALDSRVETLTQPAADRQTVRGAIDSIQATDRASSFGELVRSLRAMEQTTGLGLDVDFISDMQKTSMPANFHDLQVGPHTTLRLDSVANGQAPNWAVESVTAPARVYDPKRVRVVATVAAWQSSPEQRKVSLVLDGKTVETRDVSVPANGRAQVEFLSFDVPYGMRRGEVRIEPHDALRDDDSFPFAVVRSDPQPVLLLYDGDRKRALFYYQAAMDSASEIGLTLQGVPVQQAIDSDFSRFAFVVLSDLQHLEAALEHRLSEYVRRGGAILIVLGPGSAVGHRIPITGQEFSESHETEGATLVTSEHPALKGMTGLDGVKFFQTARIRPTEGARVLAKLADGSPLLMEQRLGEGKIMIFAAAFDNLTTDFPLHASFLPFVAQTARYLAGSEETALNVAAGTPLELRRTRDQSAAADVIGPDGRHELTLREASAAAVFEPSRDGFYEIHRAGGKRMLAAVHSDRRESDLTPVPGETLALWAKMGAPRQPGSLGAAERQLRPWPLWPYVLILLLAVVLMESAVASRHLREGGQTS